MKHLRTVDDDGFTCRYAVNPSDPYVLYQRRLSGGVEVGWVEALLARDRRRSPMRLDTPELAAHARGHDLHPCQPPWFRRSKTFRLRDDLISNGLPPEWLAPQNDDPTGFEISLLTTQTSLYAHAQTRSNYCEEDYTGWAEAQVTLSAVRECLYERFDSMFDSVQVWFSWWGITLRLCRHVRIRSQHIPTILEQLAALRTSCKSFVPVVNFIVNEILASRNIHRKPASADKELPDDTC